MKRIEFDEKCKACNGTGLYVGIAERDGYAVVCHDCNGTGKYHFVHEYEEFEGRVERRGIRRVIQYNPGIVVGGDHDFGGMSYEDWISGKEFKPGMEMRKYTCPCWWYQVADYSKKPNWIECWSTSLFPRCKHFSEKEKCWERWDKEFGNK